MPVSSVVAVPIVVHVVEDDGLYENDSVLFDIGAPPLSFSCAWTITVLVPARLHHH